MSNVPKSKRKKSDLEALHQAYKLRSKITTCLMQSFGYSEKRWMAHIRKATSYIKDETEREEAQQKLKEIEENFDCWFIQQARNRVLSYITGIPAHIRAANTIWPTNWTEFYERRLEWDRALVCCNQLQDELQYIAESLPADKNKYMSIVLEVESIFRLIHALRQSDNRFKEHFKDKE